MDHRRDKKDKPPPAVFSADPEAQIEERVRENPEDKSAQVDLGSDESMDASDPSSPARGDRDEPAPSSGFDEDEDPDAH